MKAVFFTVGVMTLKVVYFLDSKGPLYVNEFGSNTLDREKAVKPYIRNTYILHYVLSGVCHFDGFDVNAGEAFLICRKQLHSFFVEPGYSHIWIAFDGQNAKELLESFNIPTHRHLKLKVCDREFADTLSDCAKKHITSAELEPAAISFLLSMLPLLSPLDTHDTGNTRRDIQVAARFMRQHYQSPLTMEQVAAVLHISEKHLCKLFKAEFGIPPQKYLINVRMEKAAALLKTTDLKIKEIAGSVGYSSQLNFSDAFKKHFGVRPGEYSKQ